MKTSSILLLSVIAAAAFVPDAAFAQTPQTPPPLPSGTVKPNTATSGSTDIANGGFVAGALPAEEEDTEATEAAISAGALFSAGNARTMALTTSGRFRLRRDAHQFSAQAAGNFARAGKKGEPQETTVENYQALGRYDYFFLDTVAGFLQSTARRDRFQGLDLRLNVDPGAAYYFVDTKSHQLRGELGYDLQHDVRRDASRVIAAAPSPSGEPSPPTVLDKTQTLHNVRAFIGYDGKLSDPVAFVASFEYLQNVSDLGTFRLVFDLGLKSNISDKLAIATTYTTRFENKPLPNVERTDSIASVNLVYTLF